VMIVILQIPYDDSELAHCQYALPRAPPLLLVTL